LLQPVIHNDQTRFYPIRWIHFWSPLFAAKSNQLRYFRQYASRFGSRCQCFWDAVVLKISQRVYKKQHQATFGRNDRNSPIFSRRHLLTNHMLQMEESSFKLICIFYGKKMKPLLNKSRALKSRALRKAESKRRGGPAVECAFCLPIVLLFMFATLEICSALYVKESVAIACYEGVRVGVRRGGQRSEVISRCNEVLTERGITGGTVEVTPTDFTSLTALSRVRVRITVPADENAFFVGTYIKNRTIQSEVSMVREFDQ
jgi:hypothetical protein